MPESSWTRPPRTCWASPGGRCWAALVAGERDPLVLAELEGRLRAQDPRVAAGVARALRRTPRAADRVVSGAHRPPRSSDRPTRTLLRIQERKLRLRDTMEIEDANGRTVATVKKALVSPMRDRMSVAVEVPSCRHLRRRHPRAQRCPAPGGDRGNRRADPRLTRDRRRVVYRPPRSANSGDAQTVPLVNTRVLAARTVVRQEADRSARCPPSSGGRQAPPVMLRGLGMRASRRGAPRWTRRWPRQGEGGVHLRERDFAFAGFRGAVGGGDEVLGHAEVLRRVHATDPSGRGTRPRHREGERLATSGRSSPSGKVPIKGWVTGWEV